MQYPFVIGAADTTKLHKNSSKTFHKQFCSGRIPQDERYLVKYNVGNRVTEITRRFLNSLQNFTKFYLFEGKVLRKIVLL